VLCANLKSQKEKAAHSLVADGVEAAVPSRKSSRMRVGSLRGATACRGTRAATTLRAINMNDLTLIWPILRELNQPGTHGILANVFPFLTSDLRVLAFTFLL